MKHLLAIALLMISARALAADFAPLSTFLKDAVDQGEVAGGSVLVLHRGNVVFQKGFGFADLKNNTPFQVGTPVVVASISKPLLGTVAFRLSEQGKVNLAAPISESLPEFSDRKLESGALLNRAPTTLELFTHTSGIRQSESPGGRPWFATWTKGKPLEEVVKRYAAEFPFEAQPGTRYAYSGIGTDVAARVLEVASDKPRNELFVAELAGPLGMTHTFYRDAVSLKKTGPMPTRYYRGEEGKLLVSRGRSVPPKNTYSSSGGSIISTAPDLARWLMMIRNKGRDENGKTFLKTETIADMLAPFSRSRNSKCGLFIRKKDDKGRALIVGHSGSSGTNCWVDFENDIIGIMLTQTRGKDIKDFRIALEKKVRATLVD
ncbi:MAG: serine hydrolase domain-containing protein [Akkermansiaceae bacterium]|jgi:CubicO group peptidase (beta-lactamase class C family)